MNQIFNKLWEYGIVPVTKIKNSDDAIPLAKALKKGGLPIVEITFRSDAAVDAIQKISSTIPDILIGAGTVTDIYKAAKAIEAGARFIVTPGFNKNVAEFCIKNEIPLLPGCSTPTDIENAMEYKLEVIKFFPAEAAGGLDMIKAISAPYSHISFVPTGGINIDNMNDYLDFPKILAVGGSWLTPENLIQEGKFEEITEKARKTIQKMLGFEMNHIGVNSENAEQANVTAEIFSRLFGFSIMPGSSSIFCGAGIEVVKQNGYGTKGHIAILTNNIQRAIIYLERIGIEVKRDSGKFKNGKMIATYLKDEIGGFAIHLLQK